jgi:hypothetical protein
VQAVQPITDRTAARGLPRRATLLSLDGLPSEVGFGPRERLSPSAAFGFEDVDEVLDSVAADGW